MFQNIEVKRKNGNTIEKWEFYFSDYTLYLDRYFLGKITPPKKITTTLQYYDRTSPRDSNITKEAVPLPEDVKSEAIKIVADKITVKKWDRN